MTSRLSTITRHEVALVICLLAVSACGIDNDTAPRPISDANQQQLVDVSTKPQSPAGGSDRVFLLAPDSSTETHLRAAPRDVGDSATQRLASLFGALSVAETSARLRTAIPEGLQLHSAVLGTDGTLVVDVSDQLVTLSGAPLIEAVAQIVFTASEVQDVRRVDLLVDGERQQWPAADGELRTQPLTVFDYPGFVESTQPDFPAVPSPEG
jgi:spore germination protein GerM